MGIYRILLRVMGILRIFRIMEIFRVIRIYRRKEAEKGRELGNWLIVGFDDFFEFFPLAEAIDLFFENRASWQFQHCIEFFLDGVHWNGLVLKGQSRLIQEVEVNSHIDRRQSEVGFWCVSFITIRPNPFSFLLFLLKIPFRVVHHLVHSPHSHPHHELIIICRDTIQSCYYWLISLVLILYSHK